MTSRSQTLALMLSATMAVASLSLFGQTQVRPAPPRPSPQQLAWQIREYSAFVHFGINTFTDREWGPGSDSPSLFNPTDFDARKIVQIFRNAGMKCVVLTAKHHDGFCLWPSATTDYSVRNSPWKNGHGDVVREFADACRSEGLAFGIYLSPWDRNHRDYGKPEYLTAYRTQLTELLSNYGDIAEVWFDGANGGEGFYGGAQETRHIDRGSYYDWPTTWALVRGLQPNAVIFSDVGPDIRWVGNEDGSAGETCWSSYTPHPQTGPVPAPGNTKYHEGVEGHRDGQHWIPAECDVSIRPGWFYHSAEDAVVRTPTDLLQLWMKSVGRNAVLLLNVPPDRRGLISSVDSAALISFRQLRDQAFTRDLAQSAHVVAGAIAGPMVTLRFPATEELNCIELSEDIVRGQRIAKFTIEIWTGSTWEPVRTGTTVGNKRILTFPTVRTDRVRMIVSDPSGSAIQAVRIFRLPDAIVKALKGL